MDCASCKKPGATFYCLACHGGKLYCSQECVESARAEHVAECAKLPHDWGMFCVWQGENVSVPLLAQGATRRPMSKDDMNHSYHVPADVDVFKHFQTDCAMFVQAVKQFSVSAPKAVEPLKKAREAEPDKVHTWSPKEPVFGLGSHAVWHMMGAEKSVSEVEVNGEMLKAGYIVPLFGKRQIMALQCITPGAGMWVLGPDKHKRFLGMGQEGPARKTFAQWTEFLADTIYKNGVAYEKTTKGPLGRSMQLLGTELRDNTRWTLRYFPIDEEDDTTPKTVPNHCFICNKPPGGKEKVSLFQCAECHGGMKYCSMGCFDKAWKDGHEHECARIPRRWKMNLVWNEDTLSDAFIGAGCTHRARGADHEFLAGPAAFKNLVASFNTDCSAFVQLMKLYSDEAKDKEKNAIIQPLEGTFGLGPIIPWVKLTGLIFDGAVEIAGEQLKIGYIFPTDSKGERFEEIRNYSAGNGMWVLGPDRDERYLGMGKTGPLRRRLWEWTDFLADTIYADGARLEKVGKNQHERILGKSFQLLGAALTNPAHWKLVFQLGINSE